LISVAAAALIAGTGFANAQGAGREAGIRPRSSHALSIPETIAVASIIRGHPLPGIVVAIGGVDFGLGEALSWPVASAMDAFVLAIADAIGRVRTLVLAG